MTSRCFELAWLDLMGIVSGVHICHAKLGCGVTRRFEVDLAV